MEPTQGSSAGKIVASVALVGLGLAGLAMSLCGGAFTVMTLVGKLQGNEGLEGKAWAPVFLVVGSVSFLFGVGAIALTVAGWQRVNKPK